MPPASMMLACRSAMGISRGVRPEAVASPAAVPAACPMPIAVAVTRLEASAAEVAEWQRPATSRLSNAFGSSVP